MLASALAATGLPAAGLGAGIGCKFLAFGPTRHSASSGLARMRGLPGDRYNESIDNRGERIPFPCHLAQSGRMEALVRARLVHDGLARAAGDHEGVGPDI